MFGALRKAFLDSPDDALSVDADDNNPSFVTNPAKIVRLLQQIIDAPPLCTVQIRNAPRTFFTSLLEIQKENGRVIFDSLSPASGNHLLNQTDRLKLSTYISGVHLTFDLKGIIPIPTKGRNTYQAQLPDTIYYPQRRSSPRVLAEPASIDFQGTSKDTGLLVKGYVSDISRSGLCVTFPKNANAIQSGDKLTNCVIHLPDRSTFSFDLSVRSIRKTGRDNVQKQIGGSINGLSPQQQSKLDRYICALERQQIRKRKS